MQFTKKKLHAVQDTDDIKKSAAINVHKINNYNLKII